MAEEQQQVTEEAGGDSPPAPPQASSPSSSSGAKVLLKNRFELDPAKPLAHLSQPNGQAYAVIDKRDKESKLFAMVCNPELPQRLRVLHMLKGGKAPALLPMVEWGVAYWPMFKRKTVIVIYELPLGGKVSELGGRAKESFNEQDMIRNYITPLFEGLKEINARGITLRSIRPDNMYFMDAEKTKIVFGECVSSPPAYDQPVLYETIESGMCLPEGRGEGTLMHDIYSLGVSIFSIYAKKDPTKGKTVDQVVDAKIEQGSYAFVVQDYRLPLPLVEILRGLLCDDDDERWDLEAIELWLGGRRLSPLQPKAEPKSKRNIIFCEEEYSTCRQLSRAMSVHWREAIELVTEGKVDIWLRRGLEDKEKADAVELARKITLSTADPKAGDTLLAKVLMVLDNRAPIRYKELVLMPDSIGSVLAVHTIKKGDPRLVAELLLREIFKSWVDTRIKYSSEISQSDTEFRDMRNYMRQTLMGLGLERAIYESNEAVPCQSPLIVSEYVLEITELLPALEAVASTADPKSWPFDRHIAAFIACRFKTNVDDHMNAVGDPGPSKAVMGVLGTLAMVQWRHGPEAVFDLTAWLGASMGPVVGSYHNREKRRELEKEIPRVVRKGSLVELYNLLNNEQERYQDMTGFNEAKAEYKAAQDELDYLESGRVGRDEQAEELGHQTASVTSATLALVVLVIMIVTRIW